MSIVRTISSNNSGANLAYILDEKVHSDKLVHHRVLATAGQNVDLDFNHRYNPRYLALQYQAVREMAGKQSKTVQCHHLIFSFSKAEFNPANEGQANYDGQQAVKIVNDFMKTRFGKDAQYIAVAQDDANGGNLHVHVSVNSVLVNGKTLNTNLVSTKERSKVAIQTIRQAFDNHMSNVFEQMTGRKFAPVKASGVNKSVNTAKTKYSWKIDLINKIKSVIDLCSSFNEFKSSLSTAGVSVKEHKRGCGRDENGKKLYRQGWTYSFIDKNGKHQKVRDFAYTKGGKMTGLGTDFTPDAIKEHYAQLKQQQQREEDDLMSNLNDESDNLLASLDASIAETEDQLKGQKGAELTQQHQEEQQTYNRKRQTRERQETKEESPQPKFRKLHKQGVRMNTKTLSSIGNSNASRVKVEEQQEDTEKDKSADLTL